ncbi:MAG TPA: HAD hydrolase family protein [Gemmatimonadales bacterium]|nr:HAD hydrolase family protein [Gemmatimonadales bacterium]
MLDPARARAIRLVGFDVDGVLTDNGIHVAVDHGRRIEGKRFDAQDGVGLYLLRLAGLDVAWVSGRTSDATADRARELKVPHVIQDEGLGLKLPAVRGLLDRLGLSWGEFAFVGDDIADIPLLRRAGVALAVANAVPEVRALAHEVTPRAGGFGAVRDAVEMLLRARGDWDRVLARYLEERGDRDD